MYALSGKTPEAFYSKLFNSLDLNQALVLAGYPVHYICEMDERQYNDYLVALEYLHINGVIDLGQV
jgi:hypothetical protein